MSLLEIKDLFVEYSSKSGTVKAVNGVSLRLEKDDFLGLVGETGAGKTTTARSVLRLIPNPPGKICSGEILYEGKNILQASLDEMRTIRGGKISMIFQDPMTSLNPVLKVGDQISEVIRLHKKCSRREAVAQAANMLEMVGIDPRRYDEYPHQFSGGMKQRVMIAIALACEPELLIADEPTTALDVTIQAQMMDLINGLKEKVGTSMILITHDLGVVAETCNKVAIMYAGEIVEYGTLDQVFNNTAHPYTKGLFDSLPSIHREVERLVPIEGMMPDPTDLPRGCKFHPRCPYAKSVCAQEDVHQEDVGDGHIVRCHRCREGRIW